MFEHIQKIAEDIEGLPKSTDPYAPSVRDLDKKPELKEPDEESIGDIGKEPELEPAEELLPKEPIPEEPELEMPYWEPTETNNKKDIAFKRSDGFTLRARQYQSVPGKWIAQLYSKNKLLDWGNLFIPADIKPDEYLQKMADYMLDKDSLRYEQGEMGKEKKEPLEKEIEEPISPGADEDMGLTDEIIDLE